MIHTGIAGALNTINEPRDRTFTEFSTSKGFDDKISSKPFIKKLSMNKILFSAAIILLGCIFGFSQNQTSETNAKNCDVILKVEFLESGKIGNVALVSDFCDDKKLAQKAVDAAQKVKFEPQIKDGKAQTVTKTVKYVFTINDEKAEAIFKKAVQYVGGDKYLQAKTQVGRGRYAQMQGGAVISFQSFVDAVVFLDKERTEFKAASGKIVQTNTGETGWIFDGGTQTIKDQTAAQIQDYKRGLRVSLDNFLRGAWRGDGVLSYAGKRAGTLGKRNDVLKLVFPDEFAVEFEFADDGTPVKAISKRTKAEELTVEEDRYAQFADIGGIKTPFIIDRFTNGVQTSRINYDSVEFNKNISDSIFSKPKNAKDAKKDVKF